MTPVKKIQPMQIQGEDRPYFDVRSRNDEPAWDLSTEGELAVDVVETPHDVVVRAAIAGVKPEHLSISATPDTITIRGTREACEEYPFAKTHVQECHWGAFSRTIVLPHNIRTEEVVATMKNGVLTILLPKSFHTPDVPILDLD